MTTQPTFVEMVKTATGHNPYDYQTRLAEDGLTELLCAPTGAGKTLASILPWLWRRRFHPDHSIRSSTPRRLAYALPMRTLVEQTSNKASEWIANLDLEDDIGVYTLMGGESRKGDAWRLHPESDAIIVGTIDMLLSRALNRGFGESPFAWPISFGLLNNDTHWVFDEIQLLGPALSASRQLHAFRQELGNVGGCSTTWMSATVKEEELATVDCPDMPQELECDFDSIDGRLGDLISASKEVKELRGQPEDAKKYEDWLAEQIEAHHIERTLTLVFVNTVRRAVDVFGKLEKRLKPAKGEEERQIPCHLIHSRFRPPDRQKILDDITDASGMDGLGKIVISTQVLEAGVDITSQTMITETAPWPSVVQRAGRCNRYAETPDATLLWVTPPKELPYEKEDLSASELSLRELEGQVVTARSLQNEEVKTLTPIYHTLRRRDLLDLFDTAPVLSGNHVDVSPYIREANDTDCQVAWRADPKDDMPQVQRDERCSVSLSDLRSHLKNLKNREGWIFDNLQRLWRRAQPSELRAGMVIVLKASEGGYSERCGWSGKKGAISDLYLDGDEAAVSEITYADNAVDGDPVTFVSNKWVTLEDHLQNTKEQANAIFENLATDDLTEEQIESATLAASIHDIGKVHFSFQNLLTPWKVTDLENKDELETPGPDNTWKRRTSEGPWAKSPRKNQLKRRDRSELQNTDLLRQDFRHELASALALRALYDSGELGNMFPQLGNFEQMLLIYLVGAHHGRVRLGFRKTSTETMGASLGVKEGDSLPEIFTPEGSIPQTVLSPIKALETGEGSWAENALDLLHNPELGPFRLAYLEAIVRMADWRASAMEQEG